MMIGQTRRYVFNFGTDIITDLNDALELKGIVYINDAPMLYFNRDADADKDGSITIDPTVLTRCYMVISADLSKKLEEGLISAEIKAIVYNTNYPNNERVIKVRFRGTQNNDEMVEASNLD